MWELDRIEEFPLYAAGHRRHRPLGPRRQDRRAAGPPAASARSGTRFPPTRRPSPSAASRSTSTSPTSASNSASRRSSCTPGATPARTPQLAQALREHVGDDVAADVRRLGRLRPARRHLPRPGPAARPATSGTRSRCASSASRAYQRLAERVDVPLLVAETSDGAHMNTADFIASGCASAVRTGSHLQGRDHRRAADRPPRRLLPAARRGARRRPAEHAPVHGDPQHHLLRGARRLEPRASRAEESTRSGLVHAPLRPAWATRPNGLPRRAFRPASHPRSRPEHCRLLDARAPFETRKQTPRL